MGEAEGVVCASCGGKVPLEQADIVAFGTGYRCQKCTDTAEVNEHLRAAELNEQQQNRSRWRTDNPSEPSVDRVRREVEAIRARPPQPGDGEVPPPEVLEPYVESDDDVAAENAAKMSGWKDDAPPPPAPIVIFDASPRYVCIACFKRASHRPGDCIEDAVPLSDLNNPEVVGELRAYVKRRANRREGTRFAVCFSLALAISFTLCAAYNIEAGRRGGPAGFLTLAFSALFLGVSRWLWKPVRARNQVSDLLAAVGIQSR